MKNRKIILRIVLPSLLALVIVGLISITTMYGGGNKMEPLYEVKDANALTPQIYKLNASVSYSLFPVPQDNAVGTNSHKDAVTIISFPEGKMAMDDYFKRKVDRLRGSGKYLPVIGESMIGFGQERRFVLFDFKDKTYENYRIVMSLDEIIEKIAISDAEKRRIIFEIQQHTHGSNKPRDNTYLLYLIDLSGKEVKLIKEINIGHGSIWTVAYNKLFLWYFTEKEMQVYDLNLEPSQHPLADAIKNNKNKVKFSRMLPHPFLPFAILWGGGEDPDMVISWGDGKVKTPQPFLDGADQYSFSPDGKWVTFRQYISSRDERTYIMPVSEKYPNYLGTPILLVKKYFQDRSCAWTKNPVSFVASDGDIYRWELTNEAHPESDKVTFHEYIVEKDLERLAKEKKQGLGK